MGNDIEQLEEEKKVLEFKWNNFLIWGNTLSEFVRADLDDSDKREIENILESYVADKNVLERQQEKLIEALQTDEKLEEKKLELLSRKKDFYSALLSYIDVDKVDEYRSYIENDILLNEKSKDVSSEIQRKNVEKQDRVEYLQEKYKAPDKTLDENSELVVRMRDKLDIFIQRESFQALTPEQKIFIFERLITRIEGEIKKIEEQNSYVNDSKKAIFKTVQDILWEYIEGF